jgi:CheY-like chemotaxis protein
MSARLLHILLVEDNPDHAELVRRCMDRFPEGNFLCHVEDGEAALNYLFGRCNYADRIRFPLPDLVLLDLRLPRLDGLEVLRHVKNHPQLRRLNVVVLTTSDAERDVAAAFEYHADNYLTKPVDCERLGQLIRDLEHDRGVELDSNQPENGKP